MLFGHEAGGAALLARLDYVRKDYALSPRLAPVMALAPGAWMHCHEVFDEAFVARDRFYQEFLIPYGGRYVSATKLVERDDLVVVFGAHRGVGNQPLDPAAMAILRRSGCTLSRRSRSICTSPPRPRRGRRGRC
ncbi:MAG: hypothetical protein ABI920_06875 [Casimicrobiaceae bacterium]